MNTNHQHLLTQLRELHKQMGELLQQLEQAEQTPTRPNLKPGDEAPAIEWLKMMDEPERGEALRWASDSRTYLQPEKLCDCISDAVSISFNWEKTRQKLRWCNVYNNYKHANR